MSKYSDKEYREAGVEVVGSGMLWNDGYRYKDMDISTEDANILTEYKKRLGSPAPSLESAREWYYYMR